MATKFTVDDSVRRLGIKAVAVVIPGLDASSADRDALEAELSSREREILDAVGPNVVDQDPHLRSFRELHERVGGSASLEKSAPEALLRMLHRRGRLPRINPVVDIYNVISAARRIAFGAHDLRAISGDIELAVLDGTERFTPLGSETEEWGVPGEYAYLDDDGVLCRLEVKQCDKSKITATTTDGLFFVHGSPGHSWDEVHAGVDDLTSTIMQYCGGGAPRMLA